MSEQQNGHLRNMKRVRRDPEEPTRPRERRAAEFARDEVAIDWRHYTASRLEDFARR